MTTLRPQDVPRGWMLGASCAQEDKRDLPWTVDTWRLGASDVAAMSRVCAGCPLRDACRVYVAEARITGGFWAGHDRDRSAIRRQARLAEPNSEAWDVA
ncbi:WhiB family transcriptional regulator [Promicromonospora sp. NFX87]|uniref:WhiB family transcriptional regulator n=1 Tax=Promicromonospora sp. NFX87 TaxID=3402691 RepID=UPI003AFB61AC